MRGRYVKPNHSTRTPGAFIAVDTETRECGTNADGSVNNKLLLGVAVYWRAERGKIKARKELVFRDTATLWQWVRKRLSKHRTTWLWTHNLGFDLSVCEFWNLLSDGTFARDFLCVQDSPTIVSGGFPEGKLVCNDTYNWFRVSLAKLGDWVEWPKLKMPKGAIDSDKMVAYCRRDCEIVERVVNRIVATVRESDLGVMKYTAAAQAFATWRHMDDRPSVLIPDSLGESRIARGAYYGGRVECFYLGKAPGKVFALDVNGMYSAAMMTDYQPCKLVSYSNMANYDVVKKASITERAAAYVRLVTDHPFPVTNKEIGTFYAVGNYWTYLCGCELKDAFARGVVAEVGGASIYETAPVCKSFAQRWWMLRQRYKSEGNTVMEQFAKMAPNYLYGKWGQYDRPWIESEKPSGWPDFHAGQHYDPISKQWRAARCIAGTYEYQGEGREGEHSFPAISGWITASARQIMAHYRSIAGHENVYYQCVDTLHTNRVGYNRLAAAGMVRENECGYLRLTDMHDEAIYWGINLMLLDGKIKAAGLPSIHRRINDRKYKATTFERLATILARQPDGTVRIREDVWKPDTKYRHGEINKTGWTRPHCLPRRPCEQSYPPVA